ncbi:MAG: DUF177 domain-containing protein [Armatimonadetes bacterium]|nr:DUF177 domain-containing protein [Armatimonadota bacterium]
MKVDISEIKRSLGAHLNYIYEDTLEIEEVLIKKPVYINLKLTNAGSRILVEGIIKFNAEFICSSCGEKYDYLIEAKVNEEFLEESNLELINFKNDLSLKDLSIFTYSDNLIDLYEIIRQNIIIALPLKPLCRLDCLGLCLSCGKNLNQGQCGCKNEFINPVMDKAFKKMKIRKEKKNA